MAKKRGVIATSLDNSIKDAGAASVMEGAGTSFVSPFAIAMNASPFQISLLTSLPSLLAPWFQLHANKLMKTRSRKFIVDRTVLYHALAWLPLALVPFIFKSDFFRSWSVVFFFTLIAIVGGFAGSVWNSWMGDLVKPEKRGSYFGKRNRIAASIVLVSGLLAALFLKLFEEKKTFYNAEFILVGFSFLFLIAFASRLVSRYYLDRQYEPRFRYDPESYFSLKSFIKRLRNSNLGNYVLFNSLLRLSVVFAGPFFAVYMLKELHFTYLQYISMTIASSLASIVIVRLWGRLSDKFGSVKIMIISGIMVGTMPLLWLVSGNWIYLLFVNAYSGAGWCGFDLSGSNYIYDVVPRKKRSFAFAYNNILMGAGIFLGATMGGIFATSIDIKIMGSVYLFLFLASGLARLLLTVIFAFRLKEERVVEEKPIWEIARVDLVNGFIDSAFVFVNNTIFRKRAIKDALTINKMEVGERRELLKDKILRFNRKFSGKKEKKFVIENENNKKA